MQGAARSQSATGHSGRVRGETLRVRRLERKSGSYARNKYAHALAQPGPSNAWLWQRRERWVAAPLDFLTPAELAPTGDRVVLTARGPVALAASGARRRVQIALPEGSRARKSCASPFSDDLSPADKASPEQAGKPSAAKPSANSATPLPRIVTAGLAGRLYGVPLSAGPRGRPAAASPSASPSLIVSLGTAVPANRPWTTRE